MIATQHHNNNIIKFFLMDIINDVGTRFFGVSLVCMAVNMNDITILISVCTFLLNVLAKAPMLLFAFYKSKEIIQKWRSGEKIHRDILEENTKSDDNNE